MPVSGPGKGAAGEQAAGALGLGALMGPICSAARKGLARALGTRFFSTPQS